MWDFVWINPLCLGLGFLGEQSELRKPCPAPSEARAATLRTEGGGGPLFASDFCDLAIPITLQIQKRGEIIMRDGNGGGFRHHRFCMISHA